jgi:3-hydroxyisobutyrate dehydrogenase-like beta-hydroxyacid dehydrogenase
VKVGFIGLGKMGTAMAGRLLEGGHDVAVWNRTVAKAEPLLQKGARVAADVAAAATYGDICISMVENDEALLAVALADGGILSARSDGIHVAMGTHSLGLVRKLVEAHSARGIDFIAAPVLGRPPAAEAGQLGIIAGGSVAAVAEAQPLFDAMGRRTYPAGPDPVAAAAAKIINNFLLAASIQALGEAFALGEKCALPAETLLELLTDGLFGGAAHKIYGRLIADKAYFGNAGFAATTGLKDVKLALAAGEAFATPLPSANLCRDSLLSAIAAGHAEADWSVMAHVQARASGLAQS